MGSGDGMRPASTGQQQHRPRTPLRPRIRSPRRPLRPASTGRLNVVTPQARHTWLGCAEDQGRRSRDRDDAHAATQPQEPRPRPKSAPRDAEARASDPLLAPGAVCAPSPRADGQLDGTTGITARPRTPARRPASPAGQPLSVRADESRLEFAALLRRHHTGQRGSSKVWFAAAAQWKRLPNNRLVAVAPVYSTLLQVPDAELNAQHGESLAVEFGFALASPLSEVVTDRRWWKLQLPAEFRPCVIGLVLYKLRNWVHEESDALFQAARGGEVERLREICGEQPRRWEAADFGGRTALHVACEHGQLEAVQALVELGAAQDEDAPSREQVLTSRTLSGDTPLIVAAQHGRKNVVEWLLAAQTDAEDLAPGVQPRLLLDPNERAWSEVSPSVVAQSAAVLNNEEAVAVGSHNVGKFPSAAAAEVLFTGSAGGLLTTAACAWERRGGQTALIRATAAGRVHTVQCLLDHRAGVDVPDAGGFTAVHAALVWCFEVVGQAGGTGAREAPAEPAEGEIAADRVAAEKRLATGVATVRELVQTLAAASPQPSRLPSIVHTPLGLLVQLAADAPPSELSMTLIDTLLGVLLIEGNPSGRMVDEPSGAAGRTPLLWAVYAGSPVVARRLLSHGATAHAKDQDGRNAVHTLVAAVADGAVSTAATMELLILLVDTHGVSVSAADENGWTPLLIAVAGSPTGGDETDDSDEAHATSPSDATSGEIVDWLLARGAGESVPAELADGRTAATLYLEKGDKDGALRLVREQRRFEKARRRALAAQRARAEKARLAEKKAKEDEIAAAARAYADKTAPGTEGEQVSDAGGGWWSEQQKRASREAAAAAAAAERLAESEAAELEKDMTAVHEKLAELKSAEAWARHHESSWISPMLPMPGTAGVGGIVEQNRVVASGHSGGAMGGPEADAGRWVDEPAQELSVNTDTLAGTLEEMGFFDSKEAAQKKARDAKTAETNAALAEATGGADAEDVHVYGTETINGKIGPFGTMTFQNCKKKTFVGRQFHTVPSITTLNILSCAELEDVPGVVCLMPALTVLNVSNNSLTCLPSGLGKLTKLDTLRAANNLLTTLPFALAMCLELRTLDVRQNGLATVPEDLVACQWLETLDLTDNCIVTLPAVILELGSLMHLFLGANSLTRLPDLSPLEMLASLDVSGNDLKVLTPSVWELPRLRELRAGDNDLSQLVVDEGTSFLRHRLRRLRLENNKLTSLPVELGALPNLTEVCLEGNLLAEALTDDDPTISKMRATCDKHQGELML